jgi:hypothetical protein
MNDSTRHKIHKTPLNETEFDRARRVATALRKKLAPFVRDLIEQACDDYDATMQAASPCRQTQVSSSRMNREGPRHGHFASHRRRLVLPARDSRGGLDPHMRV